ncbi:MAG: hypothetical protein ACE5F1_19980 [Planctomycetota bacterium]
MSESSSAARRCVALVLGLLGLHGGASTQCCQVFAKTWGGNGDDYAVGLETGPKGNFFLFGVTDSFGNCKRDTLLLSYDPRGGFRWARVWGGTGIDETEGMVMDRLSGVIYLSGCFDCKSATNQGVEDALFMRYDSQGKLDWVSTWDSKGLEHADSVFMDSKRNVYLVGGRGILATEDVLLLKYAPTSSGPGTPLARTWGGGRGRNSANAGCAYLPKTGPECIYVIGNTVSSFGTRPGMDVLVQKYDTNLNHLWSRTWGTANVDDDGWGVTVDASGNVYVGGTTGKATREALVLSWDPSGNLRWAVTWGGLGSEGVGGLFLDPTNSNTIYLTGDTTSFGSSGKLDGLLLKITTKGQLLWSKIWGQSQQNDFLGGIHFRDEGIYIAGCTVGKGGTLKSVKGSTANPVATINKPTLQSTTLSGRASTHTGTLRNPRNRTGLLKEAVLLQLAFPSYSIFGAGCPGSNKLTPTLTVRPGQVPKLGQPIWVDLGLAKKNAPACLIIGASKKAWGPFTLPLDLTGAGAPGCWLLVSVDLTLCFAVSGTGSGSVKLDIPNDASLCGVRFHNQFYILDSTANPLKLVWSNGGSGRIGG